MFFMGVVMFVPTVGVLAQTLETVPGQTSVTGDLTGYLNNLYKFGISITGILAIFMIGLGAFAYIVTSVGNSSKMMDAKETIKNALIGLVIALTAYLLLFVINPDLVSGTLNAPSTIINAIEEEEIDDSAVGCCIWLSATAATSCENNYTYSTCNGLNGTFKEGSYTCDAVGSSYTCGSSADPTPDPVETGCCTYSTGSLFTPACLEDIEEEECQLYTNNDFTPGASSCVESTSGPLTIYTCE